MKSALIIFFLVVVGLVSACCVDQDIIKQKNKKHYVSEQQSIELYGDLVVCGTRASGVLIDFSKAIFLVTQMAVTQVNKYACGEKECLDKVERTEKYEKKAKIRAKIEHCTQQIESMLVTLNGLIDCLNE